MLRVLISTTLVAVLSASLAACGDDAGDGGGERTTAPAEADASSADFCAALDRVAAAYGQVTADDLTEDEVRTIKAAVGELVEVGPTADMSDDAREGFVLVTSEVVGLADDASIDELESAGEDFTGADAEKANAFDDHVDQACEDAPEEDE